MTLLFKMVPSVRTQSWRVPLRERGRILGGLYPSTFTGLRPECPLLVSVLNKVLKRSTSKVRLYSNPVDEDPQLTDASL